MGLQDYSSVGLIIFLFKSLMKEESYTTKKLSLFRQILQPMYCTQNWRNCQLIALLNTIISNKMNGDEMMQDYEITHAMQPLCTSKVCIASLNEQ